MRPIPTPIPTFAIVERLRFSGSGVGVAICEAANDEVDVGEDVLGSGAADDGMLDEVEVGKLAKSESLKFVDEHPSIAVLPLLNQYVPHRLNPVYILS